jgi:hypothetical protein
MAVGGQKRENTGGSGVEFVKKVGIFEAKVIAINPTPEDYKDLLGIDLPEESKATEYLSVGTDGTSKIRVDVWLEDVKTTDKFKVTFFMEDSKKENKDRTKKQYINNIGISSWASSEENLPSWFVKRDFRVAYSGEAEFVEFLRMWLGGLDFMHEDTELMLEWKKVISGNLKEWKDEIDGDWCQTVGVLATVKSVEKDGEVKSYQSIYNRGFFPGYSIKNMRMIDYNNPDIIRQLGFKKSKDLKMHERFVLNVTGEYGCKDFYTFRELSVYDPEANLVESDKVISEDGADF